MLAAVQVAYPLSNPIPYPHPTPNPIPIPIPNPISNPISDCRAGSLPPVRRAALARLERRKCGLQLGCAVAACPPPPPPHPSLTHPSTPAPAGLSTTGSQATPAHTTGVFALGSCSLRRMHRLFYTAALPLRTAALVAREAYMLY